MNEINPDNLKDFYIPEKILKELYDLTGNYEGNRGFLLFCVGQDGKPFVYSKSESQIIELGLIKSVEAYLDDLHHNSDVDPV